MRRLTSVAILAGIAAAAWAQDGPPSPPAALLVALTPSGLSVRAERVTLEQLLIAVSNQIGMKVVSDASLDDRVSMNVDDEPVVQVLKRVLRRRSYLMAYSEPWNGAIQDSPNRLWILTGERGTPRVLDGDAPATEPGHAAPVAPDVIALVDDARLSAGGDQSMLVAELSAIMHGAHDPTLREEAVYALGDIDSPQSLAVLQQVLGDSSVSVRAAVATSLGTSTDRRAVAALRRALHDEDAGVRETAVYALAEFGGREVRTALRQALSDIDAGVRQAAADVLDTDAW